MVLVLKVDDAADALPDALALDHPEGRLTLAKGHRWGGSRHTARVRYASSKHLHNFRVLQRRMLMGFPA